MDFDEPICAGLAGEITFQSGLKRLVLVVEPFDIWQIAPGLQKSQTFLVGEFLESPIQLERMKSVTRHIRLDLLVFPEVRLIPIYGSGLLFASCQDLSSMLWQGEHLQWDEPDVWPIDEEHLLRECDRLLAQLRRSGDRE